MKRVVLLVAGGVALLVAIGLVAGGSALVVVFRDDGWIESPRKRVATPAFAIVSQTAETDLDPFGDEGLDVNVRLEVQASVGDEVFIGVARASDVERYLSGVDVEEVTDLRWRSGEVETERSTGVVRPDDPRRQPFWEATASGPGRQVLEWPVRDGSFRFVVMNADGREGVDVEGRVALQLPFAQPLGVGFRVVGALGLGVGALLVVLGIRARPAPAAPIGSWAPPPGGSASPGSWTPPWGGGAPDDAPSAPWTRAQRP